MKCKYLAVPSTFGLVTELLHGPIAKATFSIAKKDDYWGPRISMKKQTTLSGYPLLSKTLEGAQPFGAPVGFHDLLSFLKGCLEVCSSISSSLQDTIE